MKNLVICAALAALCSCSVERRLDLLRPRNVGGYEMVSRGFSYEGDLVTIRLLDRKGKVKDSVSWLFDLQSDKPRAMDRNGNVRINLNRFPALWPKAKTVFPPPKI